MRHLLTNQELANKVDSEGGLYAALCYGIHAEEIEDSIVSHEWKYAEQVFKQLEACFHTINALLPEPGAN